MFDDHIPPGARWAVADGFSGAALGWGATREEALTAWRSEVKRQQPEPAIPPKPAEPTPDFTKREETSAGQYHITGRISGPSADVPWPEFLPENTPAVVLPLEVCAHAVVDWGSWVRLLGTNGGVVSALLKRDLDGCTLIGEGLAEVVELDTIEATLDAADGASHLPMGARTDWPKHLPSLNSCTVTYRLVDDSTHQPTTPSATDVRQSHGFVTSELNGDTLRWRALRQRWLES